MIFIREGTRVYKLLMLLACVGEYPKQAVCLLGNERVWKRRIRELQKVQDFTLPDGEERVRFQMLTVSGKGKTRTIRLHKSALPILKQVAFDAYIYYMDRFERHHFSGAQTHVSRNHRLAEVAAMCQGAGMEALPWAVGDIHDWDVREQNVEQPMCYLSRELKEFYTGEMKKTEYTRIAGAVVYPGGVYAVYNTRDEAMLWRGKGEEKTQVLLSDIFRTRGFRSEVDAAILFGKDFRAAAITLEDAFRRRYSKAGLDRIYKHLHFIPMNPAGIKMLEMITTEDWNTRMKQAVYGDTADWGWIRGLEADVMMDGVYHYSHLDGDLCRLIWFRSSLRRWPEESFALDCFPEQVPYLKEYLGDYWDKGNLKVNLYDLDALHTHLCGARQNEEIE
ncbi:MAG: hypothetical protein IJZ38_07415 [Bacteroides sp.]|nr:hypothetical protein [Bacteroides sp.]